MMGMMSGWGLIWAIVGILLIVLLAIVIVKLLRN